MHLVQSRACQVERPSIMRLATMLTSPTITLRSPVGLMLLPIMVVLRVCVVLLMILLRGFVRFVVIVSRHDPQTTTQTLQQARHASAHRTPKSAPGLF